MEFPLNLHLGPIDVQSVTLALAFGEQLDLDVTFAIAAQLVPSGSASAASGCPRRSRWRTVSGPWDRSRSPRRRSSRPTGSASTSRSARCPAVATSTSTPTAGTYRGVLELNAFGVGIAAVAIIDTDVPGVEGWSMFFALFLDLPRIQLGFGFTLNGRRRVGRHQPDGRHRGAPVGRSIRCPRGGAVP